MIYLNSKQAFDDYLASIHSDQNVVDILRHRIKEIQMGDEYPSVMSVQIITEDDDYRLLKPNPLFNQQDNVGYGNKNFTPSFEWIERHLTGWFELCYIMSDDGFANVQLIKDTVRLHPHLYTFCHAHTNTPRLYIVKLGGKTFVKPLQCEVTDDGYEIWKAVVNDESFRSDHAIEVLHPSGARIDIDMYGYAWQ